MASRSKNVNLLLRSVVLPRAFQAQIATRSLLTNRVLSKEISTPLRSKTLSTTFFSPLPRRPTPNILQLLQNRRYNQHVDSYSQKKFQRARRNRELGNIVILLLITGSLSIFALKIHAIKIPEFITAKYRKLRDIDLFLHENFTVSRMNAEMGRWWSYIGATFNHNSLIHLGVNMYVLWSFGQTVALVAGPLGILTLYFVGGLTSGMYIVSKEKARSEDDVPRGHMGASGSICALATAVAIVYPNTQYSIIFLPWVGIPAWLGASAFAGYSWYSMNNDLKDGVSSKFSHSGHLGGMYGGLALGLLFRIVTRRF